MEKFGLGGGNVVLELQHTFAGVPKHPTVTARCGVTVVGAYPTLYMVYCRLTMIIEKS